MATKLVQTGKKEIKIETHQVVTGCKIVTIMDEISTTLEEKKKKCKNAECENTARQGSSYCKACSQKHHAEAYHQDRVQDRIKAAINQ